MLIIYHVSRLWRADSVITWHLGSAGTVYASHRQGDADTLRNQLADEERFPGFALLVTGFVTVLRFPVIG